MTATMSTINAKPVVITRPENRRKHCGHAWMRSAYRALCYQCLKLSLPQASDYEVLDAALRRIDELALVILSARMPSMRGSLALIFLAYQDRRICLWRAWERRVELHCWSMVSMRQLRLLIFPRNPNKTDSETLLDELDLERLAGRQVLIVRGDSGRDFLADRLRQAGVNVIWLPLINV